MALAGDDASADVLTRFDRWAIDLWDGLSAVYDAASVLPSLIDVIASVHAARRPDLRQRDRDRVLRPDWFQSADAIGYVAYADLFAGNLQGIRERIGYLRDLGVTYLHLMPLLTPRPGANDGGYAVMDYRSVRPDLGTMDDLAALSTDLHAAGISLTLDLVLNHVAREHEWARLAKANDPHYRDYFYVYDDRELPDAYEATLPEIFPAFAPRNFTWDEQLDAWVWTTFNEWQWDVNWSNPHLFVEFADIVGFLANQGADCIRLDAIAFVWKRLGTNCQNQPEVHDITQALRACARIMAPAVIFKAEAIVGPQDVVAYLGQGEHAGKVSDLAYHNSLMVQIWSALAARDGRLLATALSRFAPIPVTSAWATYLRCHDDIGWAIDDADAAAVGWNGYDHRTFLADFYAGEFAGSFATGMHFQSNPETGDRRTSGSAASLAGLEAAIDAADPAALDTAIDRLTCAYAMVFGFGGLPLLYMGDELGMLNDRSYLDDDAKRADNRWVHRPAMNWHLVDGTSKASVVSARVLAAITRLIEVRKTLPALHASVGTDAFTTSNPAVLVFRRRHAAGSIVEVYNLSESPQSFDAAALWPLTGPYMLDHLSGQEIARHDEATIPPYGTWWLTSSS
ncbi:MAG: alpha-amylase family protein [Actinobacteria bacterium]|nr:alpha-amylase family protein [Actinomycetota bacterium]